MPKLTERVLDTNGPILIIERHRFRQDLISFCKVTTFFLLLLGYFCSIGTPSYFEINIPSHSKS